MTLPVAAVVGILRADLERGTYFHTRDRKRTQCAVASGAAMNRFNEFVWVNRLGQMRLETGLKSMDLILRAGVSGQGDGGGGAALLGRESSDGSEQCKSILSWH